MHAEKCYRVNSPYVVHEMIEGEVILVNLDSGSYYSLDGAGAAFWEQLDQGASLPAAVAALQAHYEAAPETIAAAAAALLNDLLAEGLVKEAGSPPASPTVTSLSANGRRPFIAPVLNKHTDMQDLLLLDPIHEVDQAGWPSAKP
jgi:hypothetical protein